MIENELIALWQSSPKHERIKFEKSKLMLDAQSSLNRFDKANKYWCFVEIGTALILIPFFTYQAYRLPNMLAKFGAILIAIWLVYVINNALKLKKAKPDEASSYLEYLNQSKAYLENHKSLSENLMYWYVLPCFIGVILIIIGKLELPTKSWAEIGENKMVWITFSLLIIIGVFAYLINKWVIKKEFLSRLKKIDELLELLKEGK